MVRRKLEMAITFHDNETAEVFYSVLADFIQGYAVEHSGGWWPVNDQGERIDVRTGKVVSDGPA